MKDFSFSGEGKMNKFAIPTAEESTLNVSAYRNQKNPPTSET